MGLAPSPGVALLVSRVDRMSPGMNLSPTETARRFGVSIKALRL